MEKGEESKGGSKHESYIEMAKKIKDECKFDSNLKFNFQKYYIGARIAQEYGLTEGEV
jgi:hypothetical protein